MGDEITSWVSFSANDISDGSMYAATGFIADAYVEPDYEYVGKYTNMVRRPKEAFQKRKFKEKSDLVYIEGFTERELVELNNLYRVYDSGKIRWVKEVVK